MGFDSGLCFLSGSVVGAVAARPRRYTARCAVNSNAVTEAPFSLDTTDDSSIKVLYPVSQGQSLIDAMNKLIISFQNIKKASAEGKRVKEDSMRFCLEHENLKLELECNPNIFPDAFHAKVYVKADDGRLSISTMAMLPKVIDSVKTFKAQYNLE